MHKYHCDMRQNAGCQEKQHPTLTDCKLHLQGLGPSYHLIVVLLSAWVSQHNLPYQLYVIVQARKGWRCGPHTNSHTRGDSPRPLERLQVSQLFPLGRRKARMFRRRGRGREGVEYNSPTGLP